VTIQFSRVVFEEYTLIYFKLATNIVPGILKKIKPPKVELNKGIILSGRGPIWLYGYLLHYYHPSRFIGIYDPRLGGAVIVETHDPKYSVGEVKNVDFNFI